MSLPPLPEPVAWFRAPYGTLEPNPLFRMTGPQSLEWAVACFTEDQLRAAAAAARLAALEEAARMCEARASDECAERLRDDGWNSYLQDGFQACAEECAIAIRSLAANTKGPQ